MREILGDPHRAEHVRRLERRARAGRPGRHRDVLDGHHQRLALHVGEADVQVPRHAMGEATVHGEEIEPGLQPPAQPLAQREHPLRLGGALEPRELGRLAEPDDAGHVQRSGAEAALVPAAVHLRDEPHAGLAPDVERAHALRPVHLVRGERGEIDVRLLDVERHLADALHRVAVEEHARGARHPPDLLDRVDDAHLVVRVHDRDEDRVLPQRRREARGIEPAVLLDVEEGHLEALPLERVHESSTALCSVLQVTRCLPFDW